MNSQWLFDASLGSKLHLKALDYSSHQKIPTSFGPKNTLEGLQNIGYLPIEQVLGMQKGITITSIIITI